MAKIIAVCRSEAKGTRKAPIEEGVLRQNYGLVGDAHADSSSHRQVSLLARESISKMRDLGLEVGPGDFAENLITTGIDLVALRIGTQISIGEDVILEISQIGKECHTECAIFQQTGHCVMPQEGVFAKVVQEGSVKAGDEIRVLEPTE